MAVVGPRAWRWLAVPLVVGVLAAGCVPVPTGAPEGGQHVRVVVDGRRSWAAEADVDGSTFQFTELQDGRLGALKGRAGLVQANGESLDVTVDVNRVLGGSVGSMRVKSQSTGKSVESLVGIDAPEVQRDSQGGWTVSVTGAWGSFYDGVWVPGTVTVELRARSLNVDHGSVAIEAGRPAINRTAVDLTLQKPVGATEMRLANGSAPSNGVWRPVADSIGWELPEGDGDKTVSVQFRGDSGSPTPPVSASIVLDTVAPEVAVDSHDDSDVIDLTDGRMVPLAGSSTDDRSGVQAVGVRAGDESVEAQFQGEMWASPLGADESGTWIYEVTATDMAGNVGSTSVTLTLILPPAGVTVVRPGVLNLDDSPLSNALVAVGAEGQSLVFSGDRAADLEGVTTLVSSPIPGFTEDGLLRAIEGVEVTSEGQTIVSTALADIFDVYAQLGANEVRVADDAEPAPRASATAERDTELSRCTDFADEGDVGVTMDLPDMAVEFPLPFPGPSGFTAEVAADARLAAHLDLAFDYDVGLGGVDIKQFHAIGGVLLCGVFELGANGSLEEALGPQFEAPGVSESEFKASAGIRNIDALSPSIALKLGKGRYLDDLVKIPPITLGPLPITLRGTVGLGFLMDPELSVETALNGSFVAGGRAGVKWDGGPKFVADPEFDATFDAATASADAGLKIGAGPVVGLKVNELLAFQFLKGGLAIGPELNVDWQSDRIVVDSSIAKVKAGICVDATVSVLFKAGIGVKLGPVKFKLDVLSFELADARWGVGCPYSKTWQSDAEAPTITTSTLPPGAVGVPYQTTLEANTDASWSIIEGALPPGLALNADGDIRGTPTATGNAAFTVGARDVFRRTVTASFSVEVSGSDPPEDDQATAVTAGHYHTCALKAEGGVSCWGSNAYGQLGDGMPAPTRRAVDVVGLDSGVVGITAGGFHTCALTNAGAVKCWGRNSFGQLGDGTNVTSAVPVDVAGLTSGVRAVEAGAHHTCALTTSGRVYCWGWNNSGQLGIPAEASTNRPQDQVDLPPTAIAIAVGDAHTCALMREPGVGEVYCWGWNHRGQLGRATSTPSDGRPEAVSGLEADVSAIAAGGYNAVEVDETFGTAFSGSSTCALVGDGGVRCWGTIAGGASPTDVPSLASGVKSIAVGGWHACAVTYVGYTKCWGSNSAGQLGDGSTLGSSTPVDPVEIDAEVSGVAVSSGFATEGAGSSLNLYHGHSCAVKRSGGVDCWGANLRDQLGSNPPGGIARSPRPVLGFR
jgi:alpha-tubulin suppressor-like RCC1 family protein